MVTKTYTAREIKLQETKYKKAIDRYVKGCGDAPTMKNKKRNEQLHYKASDEFEKYQKMLINKKKAK
jgi:hypothetical protein